MKNNLLIWKHLKTNLLLIPAMCVLFSTHFNAQVTKVTYLHPEQIKNISPDSVFYLDLSKKKLNAIPSYVYSLKNLRGLNLSRNQFTELNDSIYRLKNLQELDLGKNKFKNFPLQLCSISTLTHLSVNRNDFTSFPPCLGMLKQLEVLDFWGTPISSFPECFVELTNLKIIDARSIQFNAEFQWKWQQQLPKVKIEFDAPCNCM